MAIEAKLILTGEDQSARAFDSMKGRINGLMGDFGRLNGLLGTFGAALSAGAVAAFVKQSIDLAARLDDMAEATGGSVEELSRLSQIARIGGHDLELVESAMVRLTKVVSEGGKNQAAAFAAIGLSLENLRKQSADQQIENVAKAFAQFEDSAGKAAAGVAIFGRQWAAMAPLLKDIAETGGIVANVTREQAAAAEEAQKAWAGLRVELESFGQEMTLSVLPSLLRGVEIMKQMMALHGVTGALSPGGLLRFSLRARQQEQALALGAGVDDSRELRRGRRSITFSAPDPEAEAAKKAELKRIAGFAAGLEEDAWDRQRAQMREEDRLIAEAYKKEKALQDQLTKGQVDAAEAQVQQDFENAEALAKFQMDALEERKKAEEKLAEDARRAWERQFDIVSESLTDALMRGFEAGEDFAANFVKSLKNMFQTLVLRPIIQAIVSPVAGAITGAMGSLFPGVAQAAGGTGGSSLFSFLGAGGSIWDSLSGAAALPNTLFQNLGVMTGSQFLADIGNFGFGAPVAGAVLNLLMGNTRGAIGSAALGGIGTLIGGPVGGAIGSVIGSLFGGKKKSPAVGIGVQGTGTVGMGGMDLSWLGRSQNASQQFAWQTFNHFQALGVQDQAQKMVTDLFAQWSKALTEAGLGTGKLAAFRAPIDFLIPATHPGELSGAKALAAFEQGLQSVTQALTQEFGPALELAARKAQIEGALGGVVRGLPGALGIPGLEAFQGSLAVAEFQAPLDRVAAARRLLGENFAAAMGGDLGAVGAFPQFAQQVLGIGREVFASGPQFAEMFLEVNRMLQDVLGKQRDIQTDILKDIDVSIIQASNDQIGEIRRQTTALVEELSAIKTEIRRLAA